MHKRNPIRSVPFSQTSPREAGRVLAVLAIGLAMLVCLVAVPDSAGAKTGVGKAKVAKRGKPPKMYWGAWIGSQITGDQAPYDMNAVSAFAGLVGKQLSLVEWARPFANCATSPCKFYEFPTKEMQKVRDYGAIPFLSWSSQSIGGGGDPAVQPDFQLADVTSGRYDAFIRSFATAAKAWGHPFFLRYNWEMNGGWFPWGVKANGNSPAEFVPNWRHVHDIFEQVGVTNATWVWCPYVDVKGKDKLRQLYPGDAYVDWTCLDAYNWAGSPVNPHPWMTFVKLFDKTYDRVTAIAPDKPLILGETASSDFGGDKAKWIRGLFRSLWRYPEMHGLIYFDVNDRDTHWPLETSPTALAAFAQGIAKRIFSQNDFGSLAPGPIPPPGG